MYQANFLCYNFVHNFIQQDVNPRAGARLDSQRTDKWSQVAAAAVDGERQRSEFSPERSPRFVPRGNRSLGPRPDSSPGKLE
jgi:hypothetical protein